MIRNRAQTIQTLLPHHQRQDQQQLPITLNRPQLIPNNRQISIQLHSIVMIINTKLSPQHYVLYLGLTVCVYTTTLLCPADVWVG